MKVLKGLSAFPASEETNAGFFNFFLSREGKAGTIKAPIGEIIPGKSRFSDGAPYRNGSFT